MANSVRTVEIWGSNEDWADSQGRRYRSFTGIVVSMDRFCEVCSKPLVGKSKKYCSRDCYYVSLKGREITWGGKISAALTGKTLSPEHIQKLRDNHRGMEGRQHSLETRARMRESALRRLEERPHTMPTGGSGFLGKTHSPEAREKMAESKRGERNPGYGKTEELSPNWKGDEVGYFGVHDWMTTHYGQPIGCDDCGTDDPVKRYEWANISGEYRRDRSDFRRLCKKCHNDFDGVNAWQQTTG